MEKREAGIAFCLLLFIFFSKKMFWFWNRGEKENFWWLSKQPTKHKKKARSSAPFCNTSENENVGKWKREGFQCQLILKQFSLGLQTICKAGECCFCVRKNTIFILLLDFEGEGLCSPYHTGGNYCSELSTTEKIVLTWYIEVMSRQSAFEVLKGKLAIGTSYDKLSFWSDK